ncbi:hypothetical protein E5161_12090 [Cohnella pontilimi]|uniref:Lipoprotein n=1 Tax=Cohnella pontilimi TaxID=2564100 RepID=A0A4U0FF18_9BACL|nr:hypothetical protein [Cohnella pontilimi]TJY41932.1 hypothetical protein E5161_12090 [Cohnella pontilimi]
MNKTKRLAITLSVVMLAVGLSACGKSNNDSAASAPSASNSASSTPAASSTPSASATQSAESSASAEEVANLSQMTGAFVGLADPHTVEIKVSGESKSLQLGDGMDKQLEGLKPGDLVTLEYVEQPIENSDKTQLVVTKVITW